MIATIIGSTGLTGSCLVRQLLADPAIDQVISVSRKPLQISDEKLTQVPIPDLSQIGTVSSRTRGDIYFCCLGTTIKTAGSKENFEKVDHDAVVAFAALAKAHDAKSFTLVSAMLAHANSRIFYNRVKGQTEQDVRALVLQSLIIFRPAFLVGPRSEFRVAESILNKTLVPLARLLPTGSQKTLLTSVETLAKRMVAEGKAAAPGIRVIQAREI